MSRIPTNVITGFLGVGKTTAILDLLAQKTDSEQWAVLVNEFGEVSIDQAIMEGTAPPNVTVREVGGGCVCCATAPYLQVALHFLLTEAKPARLIVETSGLGHPGRLLETLRGPAYADRLAVRATLALVTPDDVMDAKMLANPIFREQVEIADVLVLNKLDDAKPGAVEAFELWANALFPPKLLIAATRQGRLDPAWLDLGTGRTLTIAEQSFDEIARQRDEPVPLPGHPVRLISPGAAACGWIFAATDLFDEPKLLAFLSQLDAPRLKGVFQIAGDGIVINRVNGSLTVTPSHYRHDSRIEIFAGGQFTDWTSIERGLQSCRTGSQPVRRQT